MSSRLLPAVFTATGAVAVITVLLPAGHEFGHYLIARMLHVPVEETTWTLLQRTPPSVQYRDASVSAQAWIAAGGVLLPTTVGMLLLLSWLRISRKVPLPIRIPWLILGLGYALNGVGPALDLAQGRFTHLQRLAELLNLEGFAVVALYLAPAMVALSIIGLVGFQICRSRLTPNHC